MAKEYNNMKNPKEETKQEKLKNLYLKNNPEKAVVIEQRVSDFMNQLKTKQEELKKSFGEIWSTLTKEQSEYLKVYIDKQIEIAKCQKEKMFTKEFILGFLEFIEGTYSYSNIFDHWYLHADTSKSFSRKELLKEYQKTILPPNKLDT
jgi:hypothetical protein